MIFASSSGATDFLNLHQSVKFVAGAYIFVLAVILVYVAIMAVRLTRSQRALGELQQMVAERLPEDGDVPAAGAPAGAPPGTREPEQVA
jgi:hypothetical protein